MFSSAVFLSAGSRGRAPMMGDAPLTVPHGRAIVRGRRDLSPPSGKHSRGGLIP